MAGNVRILSSFNTWGVPFASHFLFHRSEDWRKFSDENIHKLIEKYPSIGSDIDLNNDLIISTYQEAWSWRKAPFMKEYSDRPRNFATSTLNELFVQSFAVLYRPFQWKIRHDKENNRRFWHIWDTQKRIFRAHENYDNNKNKFINFGYGIGNNGLSFHDKTLIDSGLLILSTWQPLHYGFHNYKSKPKLFSLRNEEYLANKGIVWAFFTNENKIDNDNGNGNKVIGTLVMNTHMSNSFEYIKFSQLNELKTLFNKLKNIFKYECDILEIYICGDFNMEFDHPKVIQFQNDCHLHLVSNFVKPTHIDGTTIDHIFVWKSTHQFAKKGKIKQTKFGNITIDPPLFDYYGTNKNKQCLLSDHSWQGVIFGMTNQL